MILKVPKLRKAGNPAESILFYIKIREFLFQLFVDDAQIIYMPFVVLDQTDDLFFDISLEVEADFSWTK